MPYRCWHTGLAPILFDDHDPEGANDQRDSIVAPAQRSQAAQDKASRKRTADGYHVESFRSLLRDLGTLAINKVESTDQGVPPFWKLTRPTTQQQRALDLLEVSPKMV